MTLSTRQLADLAGTTVKTVRHYHDIGLLDIPERSSNGYKNYTVSHLLRLLQVKRLTDLGVHLSQIPKEVGLDDDLGQIIGELSAEIETSIERLRQISSELKGILRDKEPVDVPAEFGLAMRGMSDADRALIMIYSRVLGPLELADLHSLLLDRNSLDDEYDALAPDADDATIEDLAERYAPIRRQQIAKHPWHAPTGDDDERPQKLVDEAILALYNPAQLAFRQRVREILLKGD